MNTSTIIILISVLFAASSYVEAACQATVSASPRPGGSWTSQGVNYQMYDINVENSGSCDITSLFAYFGYPSTARITDSFNYDSSSGQITGFGPSLTAKGTSKAAGFTLAGTGTPTLAFTRPTCPCSSVSQAPTVAPTIASTKAPTVAPTTAPATSAPATPAPTKAPTALPATLAPTTAPTATPSNASFCNGTYQCQSDQICVALSPAGPTCNYRECSMITCQKNQFCENDGGVARCITLGTSAPTPTPIAAPCDTTRSINATIAKRPDGYFLQNGVPTQIYDLKFTLTAGISVKDLEIEILPIGTSTLNMTQMWNLAPVPNQVYIYTVQTYGALIGLGATYTSSGFALSGDYALRTPEVVTWIFSCA